MTDELELGFAKTWFQRMIERRVARWYDRLQAESDVVLLPMDGIDISNRRYVGAITRPITQAREEVFRRYSIPENCRMVLLSLSGSGIGDYLIPVTAKAVADVGGNHIRLIITGHRGDKFVSKGVTDLGVVGDNQNLVAAADLVISTAGKSVIDEASAAGTPIVTIPIKNHAEQERNAKELGYQDNDRGRLAYLISENLGQRTIPRSSNGVQKASSIILSMV